MSELIDELTHNAKAYFLTILGVVLIAAGKHGDPLLATTGQGLISAGLLAFEGKQAPPGNTKTLQLTTPAADKEPSH